MASDDEGENSDIQRAYADLDGFNFDVGELLPEYCRDQVGRWKAFDEFLEEIGHGKPKEASTIYDIDEIIEASARYGASALLAEFRKEARLAINLNDGDEDDDPNDISIGLYVYGLPYFDVWTAPFDLIKSSMDGYSKAEKKNQLKCFRRVLDLIEAEIDTSE